MTDLTVRWLDEAGAADAAHTGGKGANLAVLTQAGLPVPAGFVVTTRAYRDFISDHGLDAFIDHELTGLGDDPDAVHAASTRLRSALEAASMSAELCEQVSAAYGRLGATSLAVRSSATAEDLPDASFAGQQDTFLTITGVDSLCDAIRRCWSSLWTARAIAYRRDRDIAHQNVSIAVVVQKMVPAEVAGVMFTADPLSGRRDRVVIEAAPELGDAVVGGEVTPERWILDAVTRQPLRAPQRRLLTPRQLAQLLDLGARAAASFGMPQDIEWAVDTDGHLWLLQSRPITSLFPIPATSEPGLRVYVPVMLVAQGLAEPMTPSGNAFFRTMVTGWIRYWMSGRRPRPGDDTPSWMPIVADRLFLDVTPLVARPRLAARVVANFGMKDPAGSNALRTWLADNGKRLSAPQSVKFPRGLAVLVPSLLAGTIGAVTAPDRAPAPDRSRG